MTRELSIQEMKAVYGGGLSLGAIICIAGGTAAVLKILFSGRGSINIGPFKATWGR